MRLNKRALAVAKVTVLACTTAYLAVLIFAVLVGECYNLARIDEPGVGLRRLPLLVCLATTSMVASSLIGMLRRWLGKAGVALASLAVLACVAADGQEELFLAGLLPGAEWALLSILTVLLAATLGARAVTGGQASVRVLIPLAELAGGSAALWWLCR